MKQRFIVLLTGLLCCVLASAQTTVKGTVVDAQGEPVVGAAVYVEGFQSIGTMSDLDGNFTIKNVPEKAKYVVASCMGYKDERLPVQETLKFVLQDDSTVLDAAVATGMQTVDRRLMTGSTAKVDAESAKLAGVADISRSLEGQVAGVSVQNVSGTFGTAPKIRVRGATSIYGSSKPLWVVDGVIMEDVVDVSADDLSSGDASTLISSAIAGLNSDDIESFDILKDGSATSIYGARAMAGVIVVTTKKGKAGQSHISYTGEYTVRLKPSYSTFNIMNSQDQMSIYQELQQKGYLNYAETANSMNTGIYGKMYQLISQYDATSGKFGLQNTDAARAAYLRAAEYRNTDWFDLLFSNSLQHNHSVSTSGGSDKSNYYASLSLMDDPGWTLQSSVQRYTANLNTTYKIFPNLSVNMIANASYRKQRAPGTLSSEIDPRPGPGRVLHPELRPVQHQTGAGEQLHRPERPGHPRPGRDQVQGHPRTGTERHRVGQVHPDLAGAQHPGQLQPGPGLPGDGDLHHPGVQPVPVHRSGQPLRPADLRPPGRRYLRAERQQHAQL